jgi:hypothetical protein
MAVVEPVSLARFWSSAGLRACLGQRQRASGAPEFVGGLMLLAIMAAVGWALLVRAFPTLFTDLGGILTMAAGRLGGGAGG